MTVGVILTTFLDESALGAVKDSRLVDTPYGVVEQKLISMPSGTLVAIRRSTGASLRPPHEVNFRANMFAFAAVGVRRIVSTNIVGSLRTDLPPGSVVLPDQFLDFTRGRLATIFDRYGHRHVDVAEPFCAALRGRIAASADALAVPVAPSGTYVAVEGPRFETRAEVVAYRRLGGDIVGMTCATEAILARELGLCYASLALVSNFGAGLAAGDLHAGGMLDTTRRLGADYQSLVVQAVTDAAEADDPGCCRPTEGVTLPRWREAMLGLTLAGGRARPVAPDEAS